MTIHEISMTIHVHDYPCFPGGSWAAVLKYSKSNTSIIEGRSVSLYCSMALPLTQLRKNWQWKGKGQKRQKGEMNKRRGQVKVALENKKVNVGNGLDLKCPWTPCMPSNVFEQDSRRSAKTIKEKNTVNGSTTSTSIHQKIHHDDTPLRNKRARPKPTPTENYPTETKQKEIITTTSCSAASSFQVAQGFAFTTCLHLLPSWTSLMKPCPRRGLDGCGHKWHGASAKLKPRQRQSLKSTCWFQY